MFVPILLHIVIPFIVFVTIGLYVYYKYFIFNFWSERGIPFPEPFFPIGNFHQFITASVAECVSDIYQQYKKDRFVGVHIFHSPTLILTDPQLMRIVQQDFQNFPSRGLLCDEKVDPLMNNLLCVSGDKWESLHPRVKLAYTPARVKQMLPRWDHGSNSLLKFLSAKAKFQTTFDAVDTMNSYVADLITATSFGITTTSLTENGLLDNPFSTNSKNLFGVHAVWIYFFALCPSFFTYTKLSFTSRKVRKFFLELVKDLTEYRTTNNIKGNDIFDVIMQLTKNNDVTSDNTKNTDKKESGHVAFTQEDVVGNTFLAFFAGNDTTSLVIAYCLYELAMNPEIQNNLYQEITAVLEKYGDVTYDALNEMTYSDKVLFETLRKYPLVYMIPRICNQDMKLPTTNIDIPKGLRIAIPVSGIHWDPDIYPDPQKFDPERFSKENIVSRPPYTYLPFGQGPRICVGTKMAWALMKFTLATILMKYRIRRAPETPESIVFETGRFLLSPKSKIILAIDLL